MAAWLAHWLGLTSATGGPYLFLSGVAGDLGILAAIVLFFAHHSCTRPACLRYVRHIGPDGRRHCARHPGAPPPPDPATELLARIDWLGSTIMAQTQASVAHSRVMSGLAKVVRESLNHREGS